MEFKLNKILIVNLRVVNAVYTQEVERRNQSYVYTAYVDDRRAPDVNSSYLPVVRVFAWFRRKDAVTRRWQCIFWDEDLSRPVESTVVGWTDLNIFDSTIQ